MLLTKQTLLAVVLFFGLGVSLSAQEANQSEAAVTQDAQPAAPTASGRVYKSVGKDGRVIFTDAPPSDRPADIVDVKPTNTMPPHVRTSESEEGVKEKPVAVRYTRLTVVSPSNDEFFDQEVESVMLRAELEPGLQEGHVFQLLYDGNPVGGGEMSYTVDGVERGTHSVQAKVLDKKGQVVAESEIVRFHVRKMSLLNQAQNKPLLIGGDATADSNVSPNEGVEPPSGFGGVKGSGGNAGAGGSRGAGGAGGASSNATPTRR